MNITKSRRRFMLVGCSHGQLALDEAIESVLKFKREFKPHFTAHLGDWCDTTAWRKGAHGTKDQNASVPDDVKAGLGFLKQLRPDMVFVGNHEDRIYAHLDDPNALVRAAAESVTSSMRQCIVKELKAKFVEDYDIQRSWRRMGPALIGHGWMFNESAIRDHAEYLGCDCAIAHLHRDGVERARFVGGATGVCIGYLGDVQKFTYASRRKATAKWSNAFLWGEFSDTDWQFNHYHIPCPNKVAQFARV